MSNIKTHIKYKLHKHLGNDKYSNETEELRYMALHYLFQGKSKRYKRFHSKLYWWTVEQIDFEWKMVEAFKRENMN